MTQQRGMVEGYPACLRCDPPVKFSGNSVEQAKVSIDRHDEVVHSIARELDKLRRANAEVRKETRTRRREATSQRAPF